MCHHDVLSSVTWHIPFPASGWSSVLCFYQALVHSFRCDFVKPFQTWFSLRSHPVNPAFFILTDSVFSFSVETTPSIALATFYCNYLFMCDSTGNWGETELARGQYQSLTNLDQTVSQTSLAGQTAFGWTRDVFSGCQRGAPGSRSWDGGRGAKCLLRGGNTPETVWGHTPGSFLGIIWYQPPIQGGQGETREAATLGW